MRYLGNKQKLLGFIENVIKKHEITGEVFCDLFAGTGAVGDYFKDSYSIISNDLLYYSMVINKAKILNKEIPKFEKFKRKYKVDIFDWLNNKDYKHNEHYFIYKNYTPVGGRMFFSEENGERIDGIRLDIEELYKCKKLNENEYFFLLASLLESVTKVSNTSGTYEAFFKFWDSRALKQLKIEPIDLKVSETISEENVVYNEDANDLVRKIKGDIVYIDTPYTVTQYVSAYHMLETISKYDFPDIKGVGGKRDRGGKASLYCRKQLAKNQFEDLLRQLNFKHILISYSNQGIVPVSELVELAETFAEGRQVIVEELDYKEYKNHRSSNKRNGEKLREVIIYFKKDLSINKSPLNYSGSKDTLLPQIIKELPKNVEVFVDVMGGAFNVGSNISATKKVIYNEINPYIFELMNWLIQTDYEVKINEIENVIGEYNLSKKRKEEYLKLREHYNESKKPLLLYVLHMYSFQNMIRFNGDLKFNTPVGVAGYSEDIKERIVNFKVKTKELKTTNKCYSEFEWESFPEGTVFYFDPPYFITSANYNDGKRGMRGWDAESETALLDTLIEINRLGHKFILSNVIHHKGKKNNFLSEWIDEHKFKVVEIGKSGWRYEKNEVIVKNY